MNIHDHIVDLMVPFQKRWYYTKTMQGSYSIKFVLPALYPDDPELDYHNLEDVHNGTEAAAAFEKMGQIVLRWYWSAWVWRIRFCMNGESADRESVETDR